MRIREVIVVEGRYDINTLRQIMDATIVQTAGFGIFSDRQKLALIRRYAQARGVVILTDGDGAGFVIRNYLKGALPKERVKHAYIPDIIGKESRKRQSSGEGKIGVEGMKPEVLIDSLRRAGATFEDAPGADASGEEDTAPFISKTDLYADGLSGRPGSAALRKKLLKELDLPEKLTANAMLDALNILLTRREYESVMVKIRAETAKIDSMGRTGI